MEVIPIFLSGPVHPRRKPMSTYPDPKTSPLHARRLEFPFSVFILALILLSVIGAPRASAQYETAPNIDPEAAALLQSMSNYLGSRSGYSFKAEIMYDEVISSGQKIQYNAESVTYLTKPDKFAVSYITDRGGYRLWYDAGLATILEVPENDYSTAELPGTVDQALNNLTDEYKFAPALSEFLFINTYKTLTKSITSGVNVGPSRVSGTMCQQLVFRQRDIDWQIWIEDGKRPVPRKLVITYKNRPESPQFIALIKDWVSDKSIPSAAYKPEIPNINSRVEFSEITENPRYSGTSIRAFH